jgi:tetratricopeptide (TPR) repeat protein
MELQENDIQLLSDFREGLLEEPQMEALEQRLKSDPEFSRAARELFLTLDSLDRLRRLKIRAKYANTDIDAPTVHPLPQPRVRPIWIKLVAAFLLLTVSSLLSFNLWYVLPQLKKMADEKRDHYDAELNLGEEIDDLLGEYQREQNYANIAPRLAEFHETKGDSLALLYSGISYCLLKEDQEAIKQLKQLINTRYHEAAAFYLAVSYLGKGRKKLARPLLRSIVNGEPPLAAKAQQLLEEIK